MRRLVLIALIACSSREAKPEQAVRIAVTGGVIEAGFWDEIATRFEAVTGHKVEVAASGPKDVMVEELRKGNVDLITLHVSDAMTNLVSQDLAVDPQPWVQGDLVIIGPTSDPAGIRGMPDAVEAVRMLVAMNAKVVVHKALGADGVLRDLERAASVRMAPADMIVFSGQNQHDILMRAADENAYTFVGRVPMLLGKLRHDRMTIMVRGDKRLRRPYLVAVAKHGDPPRLKLARQLAEFLRAPDTQELIASFGEGRYDAASLFFPVAP